MEKFEKFFYGKDLVYLRHLLSASPSGQPPRANSSAPPATNNSTQSASSSNSVGSSSGYGTGSTSSGRKLPEIPSSRSGYDQIYETAMADFRRSSSTLKDLWNQYYSTKDKDKKREIMMKIQQEVQWQQQLFQFLTNLMKSFHQTLMGIIRNIG